MKDLALKEGWVISAVELSQRAVRSSGPGGQNVNKVASKVELRFDIERSRSLNPPQKLRFKEAFASSINSHGQVVITCEETRSQALNLQAAREKLRQMVLRIAVAPRARIATRRTRGSQRRRLDQKRKRSELKNQRSRRSDYE